MAELLTGQSFCVSYRKQSNISTANANLWRIPRDNGDLVREVVTQRNNQGSFGLTAPGFSRVQATSLRHAGRLVVNECSAQMAAWAAGFGLSVAPTITGTNPYTHTFKLSDSSNGCARNGREALYFSAQNKLCRSSNEDIDYIGCAISRAEWTVQGDQVGLTVDFVGSGNVNDPSSSTTPAANLTENLLQACNVELTYDSTAHHASGGAATKIRSVSFSIENDITDEVQPGAGCSGSVSVASAFSIRTTRCAINYVIDVYSSSAEKAAAKTAAAANLVLLIPGPSSSHSFQVAFPAAVIQSCQTADSNGYATYSIMAIPKIDGSNETVNIAAKTTTTNIAN